MSMIDLLELETVIDAGAATDGGTAGDAGDAGGAAGDAGAGDAGATGDTGDDAGASAAGDVGDAGAAAAPVWQPPDTPEARDWLDREFDARLNAWASQVDPAAFDSGQQQAQDQGGEGNAFATPLGDPLDEGFGDRLDARFAAIAEFFANGLKQVAEQAQAPYREQQAAELASEGNERIRDILADMAAREGDFNQDAANQLWFHFAQPHVARYGDTGHAVQLGVRDAAQFVRGLEKTAYDRGREAMKNELDTLSGARGEPGAGTAGAQTLPEANSLGEVTARYAEQARALRAGS